MKNIFKIVGIITLAALIGFSMAACGDDSGGGSGGGSGGTFTLTGIPSKYNGKYAELEGYKDEAQTFCLVGCQDIKNYIVTRVPISNGRVSLPMWYYTDDNIYNIKRYSGNDTCHVIGVDIYDSRTSNPYAYEEEIAFALFSSITNSKVTFSNGSATKSWNDSYWSEF